MTENSSELAEYKIFDSLTDFLYNKPSRFGPLKIKNDKVFVPSFGENNYLTYIRSKRLGTNDTIKDDGSILVFHDSSAYAEISPEFFQLVMLRKRGVYLKEQSLNIYQDTDRFVFGHHFPHWLAFPHIKEEFNVDRDIDVMYAGKRRKQRDGLYDDIERSSQKLGLNYFLGQSKKQVDRLTGKPPEGLLSPRKYVNKLIRSKIAYSLLGTGYRSHRDWEALLCGAFLLNDDRSVKCCHLRGLEEGRHFVSIDPEFVKAQMQYWIEHEDERIAIAKRGFDAAWDIWRGSTDHWFPARKLIFEKIKQNAWD